MSSLFDDANKDFERRQKANKRHYMPTGPDEMANSFTIDEDGTPIPHEEPDKLVRLTRPTKGMSRAELDRKLRSSGKFPQGI